MRFLCSLLLSVSLACSANDTIIKNVNGYTLDKSGELKQFSTLIIKDGKVAAIGDDAMNVNDDGIVLIDGQGKVLIPGLIDAHGHLLGLGATLLQVDVRESKSAKDAARMTQAYAQQHPDLEWITGRGWNQVLWPGKEYPNAAQLDEFVSNRPVALERVDGHAAWLNSKAMEVAGINKDTLDPPGGKFIRDEEGNPTGVLIDNAFNLVIPHLPKDDDALLQAQLDAAGKHLVELGITSMHDAGFNKNVYDFYKQKAQKGQMPVRVYGMIAATSPELLEMLVQGPVNDPADFLSIRSVKAYGDGALGSRGAALLQPYSDAPEQSGLLVTQESALKPLFDTVIGAGFQLNFHAIGDRANRLALDQFADTYKRIGGKELRHRIEHAQVVNVDDIPKFKTLNVIPSMQPTHATSDMNMAEDRVGKARLKGAYAWQTFLKQGSVVAFGSDFPVELANPFFGLHAAVTRQDRENQPREGWIIEESVNVKQAFRGFTLDAAYSGHQEEILGTLEPGKWADFIFIDQDIFTVPATDIWKTQVLQTWIAGEKVFESK